jgi:hypothetical protein
MVDTPKDRLNEAAKALSSAAKHLESAIQGLEPKSATTLGDVVQDALQHIGVVGVEAPPPPDPVVGPDDPKFRIKLLREEVLDVMVRIQQEAAVDG